MPNSGVCRSVGCVVFTVGLHIPKEIYTKLLESLQNRAACWICGSCWCSPTNSWTIFSSDCCFQFNQDISTFLFLSSIIFTTIVHPSSSIVAVAKLNSVSSTRNHHLSISPPLSYRRYSFFINTSCGILYHYTSSIIQTQNPSSIHYTIN